MDYAWTGSEKLFFICLFVFVVVVFFCFCSFMLQDISEADRALSYSGDMQAFVIQT